MDDVAEIQSCPQESVLKVEGCAFRYISAIPVMSHIVDENTPTKPKYNTNKEVYGESFRPNTPLWEVKMVLKVILQQITRSQDNTNQILDQEREEGHRVLVLNRFFDPLT